MKFSYGIEYDLIVAAFNRTVDGFKTGLKSPKRRIGISVLEESGYKVLMNVWVNAHGYVDSKFEFQEELVQNLRDSGIKLPGMVDK